MNDAAQIVINKVTFQKYFKELNNMNQPSIRTYAELGDTRNGTKITFLNEVKLKPVSKKEVLAKKTVTLPGQGMVVVPPGYLNNTYNTLQIIIEISESDKAIRSIGNKITKLAKLSSKAGKLVPHSVIKEIIAGGQFGLGLIGSVMEDNKDDLYSLMKGCFTSIQNELALNPSDNFAKYLSSSRPEAVSIQASICDFDQKKTFDLSDDLAENQKL